MRFSSLKIKFLIGMTLLLNVSGSFAEISPSLTLSEAEQIAISLSPELQRLRATQNALEQQAVAEDQLPDPKLMMGAANVPTDTFNFSQEDMTMMDIGLQQSFPPGRSLTQKSKQTKAFAAAEHQKLQMQALELLRSLRETWLELYYWTCAAKVVGENQALFQQLLKVTESQYGVGKETQSSVLQVALEVSRLEEQRVQIQQQIEILHAQLERRIGKLPANRPLALLLPLWPAPPTLEIFQTRLEQHPLLKTDEAAIEAAKAEFAFNKEQYKPEWMLDVGYSARQGKMENGEKRPDFVGAKITLSLPFFTRNRQDRRLQSSAFSLEATKLEKQTHYKDLLEELDTLYATWQKLRERENLYKARLVPEAKQSAKASLLAYQSATTDLIAVLRAYSNAITIQLEQHQIEIEHAKARAGLLYLEGMKE